MKVQIVNSQINKQQSKQQHSPNFKGALDSSLRFLATNQAVGANGVDLCSMVIPRTASDWLRRGPAAGMETGRRESMGTINDSALGAYGLGAGLITATAMGINDKYGTKINGIMSAPETMKILAENKADQLKQGKGQLEYFKDSLKSLKAYNPTSNVADTEGFVNLSSVFDDEGIEKIAKMLDEAVSNENVSFKDWESNKVSGSKQAIMNLITEKTGAQSNYVLSSKNGGAEALKSETNLASFLEDIYKVTESFNKPNVKKAFEEQIQKNASIKDNAYIKSASKFMKARSYGGFAIASAVGLSVQPINMYLTKLKTGSDGFVGVEGRQKDDSVGFKGLKVASAAAFAAIVMASLKTGLSGFMGKMAFKGIWPTINQLKGVYGITIISRILSCRDKDELRESLTKDTLGFLSWLVLGDIVNKLVASSLDKGGENTVLNTTEAKQGSFWKNLKRTFNSSLKTRDEILVETLSKNGINTVKKDGEKVVAKTFKEMLKDLDTLAPDIKNMTRKRLSTLNKAQIAGYAFSGLILGLGIPNLNIYVTNKLEEKRKAKLAQEAEQKIEQPVDSKTQIKEKTEQVA